jgi:ketosteroid isomerase-like protein
MNSVEDVRKTIERHNANAVRWYATGDIDSLVALFTDEAWQMPPNAPALVGREAMRAFWRTAVSWGKWEFTLETQEVAVSDPLAVERGKYVLRFTPGPGAPPQMASFEDRGNYLVHWRHDADGEWRIAADAPVSELPLQQVSR